MVMSDNSTLLMKEPYPGYSQSEDREPLLQRMVVAYIPAPRICSFDFLNKSGFALTTVSGR